MAKLDITLIIVNLLFTLLNTIVSIILQATKNSFMSVTKTSLYRYRFLIYVYVEPYFKLIMASLFFDILFYLSSFLLKRYFFKLNKENQENILTKSVQENMVSNILVELLFTLMIKGAALGFGIFYLISANKEIDKLKGISDIKVEQIQILDKMKTIIYTGIISNYITFGYLFIFFTIRLFVSCDKNSDSIQKRND